MPDPSERTGAPNLVVVIIDDVGLDKVGRYGVHPDALALPTFDRLADEGMLFHNAYALPTCTATRAALMTGRQARRTGTGSVIWPFDTTYELPLEEQTLAERLALAPEPYWPAMAGKWHLSSNVSPSTTEHPGLQGFSWFTGSMNNLWVDSEAESGGHTYYHYEKVMLDGAVEVSNTYATTDTTDDAVRLLSVLPEPFLLVVSYNAGHNPWHIPPEELHSFPTEGLDAHEKQFAMIEALDTELGRLVDALAPMEERTVVLLTGDNGTPGSVTTEPANPDRAKGTVYEGGVRVPMVVRGPGIPPGTESRALFHVVDVLPTLSELAGMAPHEAPGAGPIDGVSQVAALRDPDVHVRGELYSEALSPTGPGPWNKDLRAVRDARWKLIDDGEQLMLFDLDGLPFDEGVPLSMPSWADAHPEAVEPLARLSASLQARVEAMEADLPFTEITLR